MKRFLKIYNDFFEWSMLTEEEFLAGMKPRNKNIYFRAEWASDFPDMIDLEKQTEDILKDRSYTDHFLEKLVICLCINEEAENIADISFKYLEEKEIVVLSQLSLNKKILDVQWQLIKRIYENRYPTELVNLFDKQTSFVYIHNYISKYVRKNPEYQ